MSKNQATQQEWTEQETTRHDEHTNIEVCNECGGTLREHEQQGEVVCEDCGLVTDEDAIDRGPEWRAFTTRDKRQKSRVGAPTTKMMHDKGLSTNIGWRNQDVNGTSLSDSQRKKMDRLRTWNERYRTQDSQDRNLKQALSEITRMASALGLNQHVQETASVLYRRCLEDNMIIGRSIESMSTACLYAASRQCNTPRTLQEIQPVTRIEDQKKVKRAYYYIASELNLEMEPVDPRQYLNRFINQLELDDPDGVRGMADDLLDVAEKTNIHSGKSPTGLAASAIYAAGLMMCEEVTQCDVIEVADVSEITVRKRYQEMVEAHNDLIN